MGTPEKGRIVSLDQFRGYTVLGMFFVNFIGHFAVIANSYPIFKHHNTYNSYADTIMPQFFFAVGFAYRLTMLRRWEKDGLFWACLHALRRNFGLILLGFVLYHVDGKVEQWAEMERLGFWGCFSRAFQSNSVIQTLVHIGLTGLWVMPVIMARASVRIIFLAISAGLHLLLSQAFYYDWVNHGHGIDGGPLGFLTWTIPTLVGSLAYDAMTTKEPRAALGHLLGWGAVLMAAGYALSCFVITVPPTNRTITIFSFQWTEPPFVPPSGPVHLLTMSQRAGSISYLTFAAGFSLAVYALFVLACDIRHLRLGLFTTLGSNALAAYIIHNLVDEFVKPYAPKDAPLWFALASFGVFLAICYVFLRYLEKNKLYLRL
jgi:predicted acyltransferase